MYVDSHSHFDVDAFDCDREAVLARAAAAGVHRQIVPAIDAAGWARLRDVCAGTPGLFPAYGLHPMFLGGHDASHLAALRTWLERERPVAVGECGLDHFVEGLDLEQQSRFFDAQLRLARDFDLPVIVHSRRAVDAVVAAIRRVGGLRGVAHSFSGSLQQAQALHANGFLLGIGGPVTYERAKRLRSVVRSVPIEWLLLETDAPDQPDCRHRGERNEPARLPFVAETIARLRDVDATVVAAATTANAERLFALPVLESRAATAPDPRVSSDSCAPPSSM